MTDHIAGLHHVTAISRAPQANVDFYVHILGQRLVKKTVNFDDPGTYHLYYGDQAGTPGTIMTFFPFIGAARGHAGPGMASAVAYAVVPGTLNDWKDQLTESGIECEGPFERFGEMLITFQDPDGLPVELIESGNTTPYESRFKDDLQGFHSVTLCLSDRDRTARLLADVFGYLAVGEEEAEGGGTRLRMRSPLDTTGSLIDLRCQPERVIARPGAGTIHHVAFRAQDDEDQLVWRDKLMSAGMHVTPVIDRQYFNAIYFHEPGGVLFEIATDPPGFDVDEDKADMGSRLMLPPKYEARREAIERRLPAIETTS